MKGFVTLRNSSFEYPIEFEKSNSLRFDLEISVGSAFKSILFCEFCVQIALWKMRMQQTSEDCYEMKIILPLRNYKRKIISCCSVVHF